MRNTGLEEAQSGIKIAGRNINNLRYAADTTLMAEREEELKTLLKKVKEESEKAGLKPNILAITQISSKVFCASSCFTNSLPIPEEAPVITAILIAASPYRMI